MRHDPFRPQNKEVRVSTADGILNECHWRVRQMALPLIPERRVKGALQVVSRETGLTYSKTRKIFYRLTDHILAFERSNIGAAFRKAVERQERLYREQAERLAVLRAECEALEGQNEFAWSADRRSEGQGSPVTGRGLAADQARVAADEKAVGAMARPAPG